MQIGAATIRGGDVEVYGEASNLHFLLASDFGQNWVLQLIGGTVIDGVLRRWRT